MELWLPSWILILLATLIVVYFACTWPYDYFSKRNLPFFKPMPFIGSLGTFFFRQKAFGDTLTNIYQSFNDAAVGGYFEFLTPVLMIRDPELIKTITIKDFDYFTDHRSPFTEEADVLFGKNMFNLKGQRWRDMRHTLSPAFTSSKMKAMFLLVAECGKQLGDYLEMKCKDAEGGLLTLEMKDLFTRYATDVIATSAFGVHCDSLADQNNEFFKVGNDLTNLGGVNALIVAGYLLSGRLMKFLKISFVSKHTGNFFRNLIKGSIETREREGIIRPDMVHLLRQAQLGTLKQEASDEALEGHEDHKGQKTELSDDDLVAQAVLFFFGGFDTSSTLLCFLTHQLAVNPDIQERLRKEVDDILAESNGKVTYEGVQRMKYMDMVISETLRIFPPAVFNDRICVKPYTLSATATSPEMKINVGDGVAFPTIGIQRDPKYWPEPMKFDPERFSDENKHKIVPCTWIPFGAGPRGCIGLRFALMEAKIACATLLSRFEIEVVSRTTVPVQLNKKTFNMGAEGGFWLGLKLREN